MAKDHARLQGHLQLCSDPSYTAVSLVKKAVMGWGWDDAGWNWKMGASLALLLR
jgi:hypothetical protein